MCRASGTGRIRGFAGPSDGVLPRRAGIASVPDDRRNRRRARRPNLVELSGAEPAPETSPDPEVPVAPAGRRYEDVIELLDDKVRQAIEELPEDFRAAVVMADIEDKSYKEIAEAMDCPLGTVMSRLYRGRKLLREKLGDYASARGLGKTKISA